MKHNLDLINYNYPTKQLEKYIYLFDSIDWYNISVNQKLSEEFIDKYSDRVSWNCISYCQKLSEKFIRKHIDKIHFEGLMENKYISDKIKKEIKTLKEII